MIASSLRRAAPLLLLLLAACGGGGDGGPAGPVAVASVRIAPATPSVEVGETVTLSATPLDANGAALTGRSVSWQSESPAVASVSASGVVTGLTAGAASIRAVVEGVAGTTSVTVTPRAVASVVIAQSQPTLEVGATLQLMAAARDRLGADLPDRTIAWSVANAAIASVSTDGVLTALAPGSTSVRATSESVTGEVPLVVTTAAAAAVSLSQDSATLVPGQPLALTATVLDARQDTLSGRTITWTSSAPAVATVAADGAVTAVGVGQTTITAAVETQSATATMTVLPGGWVTPAGGSVSAGAVEMTVPAGAVAAPLAIRVDALPTPPADPRLIDGTAHDFGPDGTTFAQPVTVAIQYTQAALGGANAADLRLHRLNGDVWVPVVGSTVDVGSNTVSGETSAFSSYAVLEVPPPVASVAVTPATATVAMGEQLQLMATLRDAAQNILSGRDVAWESSNPAIATVSETGIVTGVADGGPVTITATSEGQSASAAITVSTPFVFSEIAVALEHSCGLSAAGEAYCWGSNARGKLGIGSLQPGSVSRPVAVAGGHTFTQIVAGEDHACGRKASGAVWCWGENEEGQLADGTTIDRSAPVQVLGGLQFAQITAGEEHTCGLTDAGAAWCWGDNENGGIGDGTFINRSMPTAVNGSHVFVEISGGEEFTCARTAAGAAWCWGENTFSQLGTGLASVVDIPTPTLVAGGHVFTQIDAGEDHACAVKQNGEAWCWGRDSFGVLGIGTIGANHRSTPVRVSGTFAFASVMGGEEHSCGLLTDGRVACWGDNFDGEIGDGTRTKRLTPTLVMGDLTFAELAVGYTRHTCARTAAGEAWCWGSNAFGKTGTGTAVGKTLVPTRVLDPMEPAVVGGARR